MNNSTTSSTLTQVEYLELAHRYRGVADSLQPAHKLYYLAKAAEYEALAKALADPTPQKPLPPTILGIYAPQPEPQPQPLAQPVPQPEPEPFPNLVYVDIFSTLALAVMHDHRAGIQQAFVLWSMGRQWSAKRNGKPYWVKTEFIDHATNLFGRTRRTIQRWLAVAEGLFFRSGVWHDGRVTLSLIGRDRVLDAYSLVEPGKKMSVDVDRLTASLADLRACLFAMWQKKESQWAARTTIKELSGVPERTQRNYELKIDIKSEPIFSLETWWDEDHQKHREAKQLPNRYFAPFQPARTVQQNDRTQYGRRTQTAENKSGGESLTQSRELSPAFAGMAVKGGSQYRGGRVLFDVAKSALEKAEKRAIQGQIGAVFWAHTRTCKGKILCRPCVIADKAKWA